MATSGKKGSSLRRDFDLAFINYLNGNYDELTEAQRQIFCGEMPEMDRENVTLRSLCDGLGIAVPDKFRKIADKPQKIAFRSNRVKKGDVCLVLRSAKDFHTTELTNQYQEALERGAKLVIMSEEEFSELNLDKDNEPVILMDHANERIFRLYNIIRKQYNAKVVMLTGSVGKTTTKDLCTTVANSKFNIFANANNTNTPQQVAMHLFNKADTNKEVYIQEAGAGYFGSVRLSATLLQPDIFVLTNVYNHHLQVYKTFENIFADKVSADDYLSPNGVIITNFDDENIRNHNFKHTVRSFSIHYPDADFRAHNIRQHQEHLSFDIVEKATGITTPITVQILGEHNVYNILAAFVMGKALGMTDAEAADALSAYRAVGVRQNLANVGGVHFLLDCYNVAEESILAMLSAGEKFNLDPGAKRIALVGGENKLGKNVRTRSKDFGAQLAKFNIDQYLFCGTPSTTAKDLNHFGDAVSIQEGFQEVSDIPNELALDVRSMTKYLKANVKRGDLVLVKGIYYLQMPFAIDKAFGTSFSFSLSHNVASMVRIKSDGYRANLIPEFGELELSAAPVSEGAVTIPDTLENHPVFRIRQSAFSKNGDIQSVQFGKKLRNIGDHAFSGCTNLSELSVPGNVRVIETAAFSGCENLKKVTLNDGTTHIAREAFAGCQNLKTIQIPNSVGLIEEKAFSGCPQVKIRCCRGSYAQRYARENKLRVRLIRDPSKPSVVTRALRKAKSMLKSK